MIINISDITFYKCDEDGNEVTNKDGTVKEFRIKEGYRYKPLEYLCEDMEEDIIEESEEDLGWRYKKAYHILMEHFDSLPDDVKEDVNKKLNELSL